MAQPISEPPTDSVAEMGSRITRILVEQPDIVDYVGRALVDGSPMGIMIFDSLMAFGTARWNRRADHGESRPDLDLTWAALNSLLLALSAFILRTHIDRQLPEPLTTPSQLQRWQSAVNMLLREGLFRRSNTRRSGWDIASDLFARNPFAVRRWRLPAELGEGPGEGAQALEADGRRRLLHRLSGRGEQSHRPQHAGMQQIRPPRQPDRVVERRRSVRSDTATDRLTSSAVTESRCSFV